MRPSLSSFSRPLASLATSLPSAADVYNSLPDVDISSHLRYYEPTSPGSTRLPPSARVNPSLQQVEWKPLGFFGSWKYIAFILWKVCTMFYDFIRHVFCGPRKTSWGLEMTFLTSLVRDANRYSHLMNVSTLRSMLGIIGLAPIPSSTIVTPVTFQVRRRRLKGFLGECGLNEDGTRQLSGEWVVDKNVWRKFQSEWKGRKGVKSSLSTDQVSAVNSRVILFIHGGAYCLFSPATHRQLARQLSRYTDCRVFSLDYRLAPETRFPGQITDAFAAYMRLVEELGISPKSIILAGDSAGGGLCLALLFYMRDNGYPLPAGSILLSPWVDLTMSCDSWETNAAFDIVPIPNQADHMDPISNYLGRNLSKFINHPYASPLFGDFRGLPPLLIQAGDSEVLRDESRLLSMKAAAAGVLVKYEVYKDAVHVFQNFPFLEESQKAFRACGKFVKGFSSHSLTEDIS